MGYLTRRWSGPAPEWRSVSVPGGWRRPLNGRVVRRQRREPVPDELSRATLHGTYISGTERAHHLEAHPILRSPGYCPGGIHAW